MLCPMRDTVIDLFERIFEGFHTEDTEDDDVDGRGNWVGIGFSGTFWVTVRHV